VGRGAADEAEALAARAGEARGPPPRLLCLKAAPDAPAQVERPSQLAKPFIHIY